MLFHQLGELQDCAWPPQATAVPVDAVHGFRCGWTTATAAGIEQRTSSSEVFWSLLGRGSAFCIGSLLGSTTPSSVPLIGIFVTHGILIHVPWSFGFWLLDFTFFSASGLPTESGSKMDPLGWAFPSGFTSQAGSKCGVAPHAAKISAGSMLGAVKRLSQSRVHKPGVAEPKIETSWILYLVSFFIFILIQHT